MSSDSTSDGTAADTAGPERNRATRSPVSRARRVAGRAPAPAKAPATQTLEVLDPPAALHEEPRSRAGRNLPAAIGVGLGLGGLIIATLFIWRPAFAMVAGLAVLYGCYELSKALANGGIRITLLPLLVGSAAMLVAAWERGPSGLVLGALITVLGIVVWRIGDGAEGYSRDVGASALVVLYLPLLAGFAVLLAHPHDGAGRVIAFVATVVCSDTGGYAAGVLFGKHPLAPIISKGKTWEGFAGSVFACSGAGVLFFVLTFHQEWWKGMLFGLAIVVTATLGDLGESMMKRDIGIKDMGSLLPGHGGIMDRLDSLLPCAAVAYLILSGFAPV
ncbi:phosphatidate cytidylyltransferase [uncultured Jatrophihabitans sp.]|uniref:phosphatidate cytidylyltransferase n=1 Tax=uncultured Jatrophihabitans sp. TaxID=1610747 RepID=UPI0035CA15BE